MGVDFSLPADANLRVTETYGPFKKGEGNVTHAHPTRGHMSLALRGSFDVEATLPDGSAVQTVMDPWVYVRKQAPHKFTAREDGSIFICVWGCPEAEDAGGEIAPKTNWPDID